MTDIEKSLIRGALVMFGKAPKVGTKVVKEQLYGYIKAVNFAHQFGAYDEIYKIWDASLNLDLEQKI